MKGKQIFYIVMIVVLCGLLAVVLCSRSCAKDPVQAQAMAPEAVPLSDQTEFDPTDPVYDPSVTSPRPNLLQNGTFLDLVTDSDGEPNYGPFTAAPTGTTVAEYWTTIPASTGGAAFQVLLGDTTGHAGFPPVSAPTGNYNNLTMMLSMPGFPVKGIRQHITDTSSFHAGQTYTVSSFVPVVGSTSGFLLSYEVVWPEMTGTDQASWNLTFGEGVLAGTNVYGQFQYIAGELYFNLGFLNTTSGSSVSATIGGVKVELGEGSTIGYDVATDEEQSYQDGYDDGYEAGLDVGYEAGREDGYYDGYDEGLQEGYNNGYAAGVSSGSANKTGWSLISDAFSSIFTALDVNVFGFFSLGDVIAVVFIFAVVFFVFKLFRG